MSAAARRFPSSRPTDVLLPTATARRLCDEAVRARGPHAVDHLRGAEVWILFWKSGVAGAPFGGCRVRWEVPTPATASVVEVGWNDYGSYADVADAANVLTGWPLFR